MPGEIVTLSNLADDHVANGTTDKIHSINLLEGTGAPVDPPPVPEKVWIYADKAEDPVALYTWDTVGEDWNAAGGPPAVEPNISVVMVAGGPSDVVVTGDGQWFFTVPDRLDGYLISEVHGAVPGAVSTSGVVTVQLARVRAGVAVDVLSTAVTIDANQATSYTAATPSVVNAANDDVAEGDFLRVDVDTAGTDAAGLQVIVDLVPAP